MTRWSPPRPRSAALAACALLAAAFSGGCASWSPPPPPLLEALRADADPPRHTRWSVTAQVEGRDGAGQLRGVLLVAHGASPQVRLQLFPDLGGKVLDLWIGPEGYTSRAEDPLRRWQDGEPIRRRAIDDGPRCEMDVLALSLRRALTPLDPARVEGAVRQPPGWRLKLPDTPEGVDLEASVTADGSVTAWAFSYVTVSWTLAHDGDDLVFSGDGVRVRLVRADPAHPEAVPDGVFSPPSEPS